MHEKLRMQVITGLATNFTTEQLQLIDMVLISQMANYEITERSTDIVVYQEGLPIETHMLAHGASLAEVQMLLGHESPATTQVYAKLDLQSLQAVHQRCII